MKGKRRPWTQPEETRLLIFFERGHTETAIAKALNRTLKAITARREHLRDRAGGRDYYLASDIAKIMGLSKSAVYRWISHGWLPSSRSGQRSSNLYPDLLGPDMRHISREQVVAFLSDELHWGRWFVQRVHSGYWRDLATHLRGNARLISPAEAGALLCMTAAYVCLIANRGKLPFVRGSRLYPDGQMGGRAIWIRADLIPASMLPRQQRRSA